MFMQVCTEFVPCAMLSCDPYASSCCSKTRRNSWVLEVGVGGGTGTRTKARSGVGDGSRGREPGTAVIS